MTRAKMANRIRAWGQDPEEEVRVAGGHKLVDLHMAMDRVQDKDNWKMPVVFTGRFTREQIAVTTAAIQFFAGSWSDFEPLGKGQYRVTAPGYYMSVGA